jgi:hypothetical protein
MRLLNTRSYELSRLFVPNEVPDYVILSHRWSDKSDEEVTFTDMKVDPIANPESGLRSKEGFQKIRGACEQACRDGYSWIWIDNCCIDKSSSAELQETINSMWRYYAESNICYVHMADVNSTDPDCDRMFARSQWFERCWTLQELIAPLRVEFYARNWAFLGTKFEKHKEIVNITSINKKVLLHTGRMDSFSTAEKMSWAAHREATREEDEAYSLLGLFDVNMPLLYGEGPRKAFVRLQEAVYKNTADQSIFLFSRTCDTDWHPLLADSPTRFCDKPICNLCALQRAPRELARFRNADILTTPSRFTQAHAQIMTTVTRYSYDMSTLLDLLKYREVSSQLKHFSENHSIHKWPSVPTHVAVLNATLTKYPEGAFCILLYRERGQDRYTRIQACPAILPKLGFLVSKVQRTKVLTCAGVSISHQLVNISFSLFSKNFRLDRWAGGDVLKRHGSATYHEQGLVVQFCVRTEILSSALVLCHIVATQDPPLLLTVVLNCVNRIWMVYQVLERKQGERAQPSCLLSSSAPTDGCSLRLRDGKLLMIALRPMSALARGKGRCPIAEFGYRLVVSLE